MQLEPRTPLNHDYDMRFYKDGKYLLHQNKTKNPDLSRDFTFVFPDQGSYNLTISNIRGTDEKVVIPIQVTPEFPLGVFVVIAGLLTSVITITRMSFVQPKSNR